MIGVVSDDDQGVLFAFSRSVLYYCRELVAGIFSWSTFQEDIFDTILPSPLILLFSRRARSSARIEQQTTNLKVAGSTPAGRTIFPPSKPLPVLDVR